jgi:hypothetical protein
VFSDSDIHLGIDLSFWEPKKKSLHRVIYRQPKKSRYVGVVKLLLQYGANRSPRDEWPKTLFLTVSILVNLRFIMLGNR